MILSVGPFKSWDVKKWLELKIMSIYEINACAYTWMKYGDCTVGFKQQNISICKPSEVNIYSSL